MKPGTFVWKRINTYILNFVMYLRIFSVGNLVELAGHMDAGIGHDTLAQEQFGSLASHDEDDDADHDDEEDDF